MHNPYSKWTPPRKPRNYYSEILGYLIVDEFALDLKNVKKFHRWLGRVIEWTEYKREKEK